MQSTFIMNKYLRLTFIFAGVWFIASLINGVLSTLAFAICSSNASMEMAVCIPLSFLLAIPFVALTWFIAMIVSVNKVEGYRLYRIILNTAFLIGCAGAVFFKMVLYYEQDGSAMAIPISIIVSAVSSIMIFRKKIKATN